MHRAAYPAALCVAAYPAWNFPGVTLGLAGSAICVLQVVRLLYTDVKPVPPPDGIYLDDPSDCTLFKYIPELQGKINWQKLGNFPTPLGRVTVTLEDGERKVQVYLKREDLSSSVYGGNKVRTLEHQLPCAVTQLRQSGDADPDGHCRVTVMGGPGSNQCVATAAHGATCGAEVSTLWLAPEAPSDDNGYNFMSVLSLQLLTSKAADVSKFITAAFRGTHMLTHGIPRLLQAIFSNSERVLMPGGANVTGVLGHMGAALELSAQIDQGELPQAPDHIWLPVGSGCTTGGLLAGIAVSRAQGGALGSHPPALHGVIIHQGAAKAPWVVKLVIRKYVSDALELVAELGGVDAREYLDYSMQCLHLHTEFAGEYGAWTPEGKTARQRLERWWAAGGGPVSVDKGGKDEDVQDQAGQAAPPWLCSCFSSKAFAAMLTHSESRPEGDRETVVFWSTKSLVQPASSLEDEVLSRDVCSEMVHQLPGFVSGWIEECGDVDKMGEEMAHTKTSIPELYYRWRHVVKNELK